MTGRFTSEEITSQLRDAQVRSKCRYEEKRADMLTLVQQDIAKLICTVESVEKPSKPRKIQAAIRCFAVHDRSA